MLGTRAGKINHPYTLPDRKKVADIKPIFLDIAHFSDHLGNVRFAQAAKVGKSVDLAPLSRQFSWHPSTRAKAAQQSVHEVPMKPLH